MSEPAAKPEHPADSYGDVLAQVNSFIARFGQAVGAELDTLDETGFAEMRCGHVSIGINANREHGTLLFLARVSDLPSEPPPEFYRQLLELNFLATGPCAFAIDDHRSKLYLRAMRPLSRISYEEFASLLHTLAAVVERLPPELRHPEETLL